MVSGEALLFVFMVSVFVWWWGEKRRLCCLRESAGTVCLVAFAGKALSVQSGFLHQIERVGRKPKFMLRNGQAAFVSFHGRFHWWK
jgi:hypothetical protein